MRYINPLFQFLWNKSKEIYLSRSLFFNSYLKYRPTFTLSNDHYGTYW